MPEFMIYHTHPLEDCARMNEAYRDYDTPLKGLGKTFICYGCPTQEQGEHGAFIHVEADEEAKVLVMLPEIQRPTTTVYPVSTLPLDV